MNLYLITDDMGKTHWIVAKTFSGAHELFERESFPRDADNIKIISKEVTIQSGKDYFGGIG